MSSKPAPRPDNMLDEAERDLQAVRARMYDLALPLHGALAPAHKDHAGLTGDALQNTVIGEVLAKIADNHSTRESYMDDARKDLDEARAFVQEKGLLKLPSRSNLQVIPTPEFMRGIYPSAALMPLPRSSRSSGPSTGSRRSPRPGTRSAPNPNCANTTSTS